ncbi:hypothetical protein FF1_022736 [Malus domestica]
MALRTVTRKLGSKLLPLFAFACYKLWI